MANTLLTCVHCEEPVHRGLFDVSVDFPGREPIVVWRDLQRCSSCGETYFGPDDIDAVHRAAADVVRANEGLLSPEEIRELRESLHLSQAAFERLIGAGAKTVVRWERGTIFQSKVTDTLMRVLRAVPEAREFLAANAKVTA
jgi:HTH-type transcriptional regulator / antitoxin MqsA